MRRVVDATLPAGCLIAIIPSALHVQKLPVSLHDSLGPFLGWLWAATLAVALLLIVVGIVLRWRRPGLAFILEWPALFYAGFITAIYGIALTFRAGVGAWVAYWFVYAIAAHFLARFWELSRARGLVATRRQ